MKLQDRTMRSALFSRRAIGYTLIAFLLITGCTKAALWQYQRGVDRHALNTLIKNNTTAPAITSIELTQIMKDEVRLLESQWRTVSVAGQFITTHEILLPNRYKEGKYGFGVLTLFQLTGGEKIWVDRGWVLAGKDASTPPTIVPVTNAIVSLQGRLRTIDRERQVQGSFFAQITEKNESQLKKWNESAAVATANFSIDLLKSSDPHLTPLYPNELPELSDGPHMAYALQWLVFAFLIALARILIFREDLRLA